MAEKEMDVLDISAPSRHRVIGTVEELLDMIACELQIANRLKAIEILVERDLDPEFVLYCREQLQKIAER